MKCLNCNGNGRVRVQDAREWKDPPPPTWINCDACNSTGSVKPVRLDCKVWPNCDCIMRGNAKMDCGKN